jgi:hypothetical protein
VTSEDVKSDGEIGDSSARLNKFKPVTSEDVKAMAKSVIAPLG